MLATVTVIRDPNCLKCNFDTHICLGCGAPLRHWQSICRECKRELRAKERTK